MCAALPLTPPKLVRCHAIRDRHRPLNTTVKLPSPSKTKNIAIFILDQSGSMMSYRESLITTCNDLFKRLKREQKDDIEIIIIKFNDNIEPLWPIPYLLSTVPDLTEDDYKPVGSTALYDVIHLVLSTYKDINQDIFLVIATDGQD